MNNLNRRWFFLIKTNQSGEASELLPNNWNTSDDLYQLKYIKDGSVYILKCIIVEKQLLISFVVCWSFSQLQSNEESSK